MIVLPILFLLNTAQAAPLEDNLALTRTLHEQIVMRSVERSPAAMKPYKNVIPGTDVPYEMLPIPGGKFTMGTPDSERGHQADESPEHRVRLEPFWMASREVTWNEYRLFMFATLSGERAGADKNLDAVSRPTKPYMEMSFGMGTEGFPAISMTQHAANKYAEWLSAKTGHFYRLPTEAEWEYACRAGTTGDSAGDLKEMAWYSENSGSRTHAVGQKQPNAWGLADMHGNVWEWCEDWYHETYYGAPTDGSAWLSGGEQKYRVLRGGSWVGLAASLRSAFRGYVTPDSRAYNSGFRIVAIART